MLSKNHYDPKYLIPSSLKHSAGSCQTYGKYCVLCDEAFRWSSARGLHLLAKSYKEGILLEVALFIEGVQRRPAYQHREYLSTLDRHIVHSGCLREFELKQIRYLSNPPLHINTAWLFEASREAYQQRLANG